MLPLRALWDGSSWGQDAGELDENELLWKVEACSDLRGAKSEGKMGGGGGDVGRCWEQQTGVTFPFPAKGDDDLKPARKKCLLFTVQTVKLLVFLRTAACTWHHRL